MISACWPVSVAGVGVEPERVVGAGGSAGVSELYRCGDVAWINLPIESTRVVSVDVEEVGPMGIMDALAGRQQAVDVSEVANDLAPLLVAGEQVESAFRVFRDILVFTDRRLISIDRQGVTGKKVDYRSVPYSNITMFSKESAGILDMDAELKIWIRGLSEPLSFEFNKDAPINDVYMVVSKHVLKS